MHVTAENLDPAEIVKPRLKKAILNLHIVAGLHLGASQHLHEGEWLLLGSAEDCDVLLSDEGIAGHHCLLGVVNGRLCLRSLEADVHWGEEVLLPGETLHDFMWGELQIGRAAIQLRGEIKRRRWSPSWVRHYSWIALSFVMSTFATYGMAVSIFGKDSEAPVAAAEVVDAAISEIKKRAENAELHNETTRMTASVREIMRLSGIDAQARYLDAGKVELSGYFGNGQGIARVVQSRAMREILGLQKVVVVNKSSLSAPLPEIHLPTLPPAASKMVKIISGSDPYLVASDGSRYYPGATLPNGARLLAVLEQALLVETAGGEEAVVGVDALLGN